MSPYSSVNFVVCALIS